LFFRLRDPGPAVFCAVRKIESFDLGSNGAHFLGGEDVVEGKKHVGRGRFRSHHSKADRSLLRHTGENGNTC
jgi:hypothetical protein